MRNISNAEARKLNGGQCSNGRHDSPMLYRKSIISWPYRTYYWYCRSCGEYYTTRWYS